jgi:anthranilate synthase
VDAVLRDDPAPGAPATAGRGTSGAGKRVLFVDCEDSFVQTLGSYVRSTGAQVATYRPGFPESLLDELSPDLLFLSPGPKAPRDFDLSSIIGWAVKRRLPLFGVCLGHQGIAEFFGARLGVLPEPVHGKPALIRHDGSALFAGVPEEFSAARYHSLYVVEETVPEELLISARSQDGVIMGLRHRELPIASVQFHPESILTLSQAAGWEIINNLFKWIGADNRL